MKKLLCLLLFCSPAFALPLTCNGVNDDANIATALTTNDVPVDTGLCVMTVAPTLYNRAGIKMVCKGDSGQTDSCVFRWDGPNGGMPFQLNQVRDSTFEGISILPGAGTLASCVEIDAIPPYVQTSTNNQFIRVHCGASTDGFYIARNSTQNNELHTFYNVTIDGPGTTGIRINQRDSKSNRIIGGSIANRTYGIYNWAGSFNSDKTNFSYNGTDIYVCNITDTLNIRDAQSEGAHWFLNDCNGGGGAWSINIEGGRLHPGYVGGDGVYIRYLDRGPLNIEKVDFASGVPDTRFRILCDNDPGTNPLNLGCTLNSRGNIFPNSTPYGTYRTALDSVGNMYVDSAGHGQPLPKSNTQP